MGARGRMPRPVKERFEEKLEADLNGGCLLFSGNIVAGYGQILDAGRKYVLAHRLAYELYVGTIPHGKLVLHRCDVRVCCNPAHLFLGTQAENMDDMCRKGRHRTHLTGDVARQIFLDRRPYLDLAKDHGVSVNTVSKIKRRVGAWRYATDSVA